jgi:hypothetical protein
MSFEHPPLSSDGAPFDDENPEWTAAMFAKARPAEAVLPPEVLAAFKRPCGLLLWSRYKIMSGQTYGSTKIRRPFAAAHPLLRGAPRPPRQWSAPHRLGS